ncbi:MAG: DUF2480 family protein [Bacteroidia bacterium]
MSEIVNRIAQSPIVTFKLEEHIPAGERVELDIKPVLFMEMILREKDFRAWVKEHDWEQYAGKHVALTCSVDTVIQTWAWMILTTQLAPFAKTVMVGTLEELEKALWQKKLAEIDFSQFEGKPVVVKGCSTQPVPPSVYAETARLLLPYAKKISFGEPCSTVPVWKSER